MHRAKLLDSIVDSPLLTEDDFQLVHFIASNHLHHSHLIGEHSQRETSHHHATNRHAVFLLATILVGVSATAVVLLPVQYILTLIVLATVVGGVPLAMLWWRQVAFEQRLGKSVRCLLAYLKEFEVLLSLVTQTTRLIRETEIISHGFSRYMSHDVYPYTCNNVNGCRATYMI